MSNECEMMKWKPGVDISLFLFKSTDWAAKFNALIQRTKQISSKAEYSFTIYLSASEESRLFHSGSLAISWYIFYRRENDIRLYLNEMCQYSCLEVAPSKLRIEIFAKPSLTRHWNLWLYGICLQLTLVMLLLCVEPAHKVFCLW